MTAINPDFSKNFDAIFFDDGDKKAKGIPKNEQGRLAKFYTTSLNRHDKSNFFFAFLAKVVHKDNYDRGKVLTNIVTHLKTNSATLREKITPDNYTNFKTELLAMASALADKLPNGKEQCATIKKLVEGLAPSHPPSSASEPHQVSKIKSDQSSGSLSQQNQQELDSMIADLDSFIEEFDSGPKATEVVPSPSDTPSPSLLKMFEEAEAMLSKESWNIADPIVLNSFIRDIQNDPSFKTSKAHIRLIPILEKYLNRTVPLNQQGTLPEQISALEAHIKQAHEIAKLIPDFGSQFIEPTSTAAAWKMKIQDLEKLKDGLLEKTQANMEQAANKWIPQLQQSHNHSEKITSAIKELASLVARSPLGSITTTNFATLSGAVTRQLQLAQTNFRAIDAEVSRSMSIEKDYLEKTNELMNTVLDRMDHFKVAAKNHDPFGSVTKEAFTELSSLISQKKDELEQCQAEINEEKTSWYSRGNPSAASILRQRTLELEILTLEHQRIVFDSKLMMHKFATKNLYLLQQIKELAEASSASIKDLPKLEAAIKAYTDKCKKLNQDLETNIMILASHKTSLSILHASLMAEHKNLTAPKEIEKSQALLNKIESQKTVTEHDLTNFVSFQRQLNEEMESKVQGIGNYYNQRIKTDIETSNLLAQREKPAQDLAIAEQNQKKLKDLSELVKQQADWIILWTASETSPQGNSVFENFLREFAVDAKARGIPEDQWASKIIQRLEMEFNIPDVHKPFLADNLNKALGKMLLIPMQLPELRQST